MNRDYLNYQFADGYQLTVIGNEGEADVWLNRKGTPRSVFGIHFTDDLPFDLAALGFQPHLYFDHADRPYVVWPCGGSALVWRCEQRTDAWITPAMDWSEARAP